MKNDAPIMTTHPPHGSPRKWSPFLMSLLTHFLLAIFLILFSVFVVRPTGTEGELRRAGIVLTEIQNENQTEYLDPSDFETRDESLKSEPVADPASLPPPSVVQPERSQSRPELPGMEAIEASQLDANSMVNIDSNARVNSTYQLSDEDLKQIRADQARIASQQPKGEPTTISVFGTPGLSGRSFVFVLDRSKSMGSSGLGVIDAAKDELSYAINQLQPNHQFQIVGYHQQTVTMNTRKLLAANEENKKGVPGYISNLTAFGSTNHENGLMAATYFKPDIIVLMTDGGYPELNAGQLKMLKRFLSSAGSQVHCIQFGLGPNQSTTHFMKKLSQQNNGSYRYIDVSKWNQENNE
ncbi:MAG: VWA domain-containing protein [Planctomycetota bacterium]